MDGLESVTQCPVCGHAQREILHTNLIDKVFRIAPGKWALWKCKKCESAYLDPRPNRDTIHLAYESYYTHQAGLGKDDYASLSPLRKLRRRLVNGYTNWRYSTHAQPSSFFGLLAAFAMPNLKKFIDREYRHLPKQPKSGGVLLDLGCGNGSFVNLARACGWNAVGLDMDPKAVANATKRGLTVHQGGIEYYDGKKELFDVITVCHVIEHVFDPAKVLESCYALLKPGGQLWLETPNIDSFGYARFKNNWRDLDPPRHLVLFNRRSLNQAIIGAGFHAPHDLASPSPCPVVFKQSLAMEKGYSPFDNMATPVALKWQATKAVFLEKVFPSRREFLTVTAIKTKTEK